MKARSILLALAFAPTVSRAQLPPPAAPPGTVSPPPKVERPPAPAAISGGPLPAADDVLIVVPGGETALPPRRALSKASVGGVPLHGLSETEAARRVRETFAPLLEKRVAFFDGRATFPLTKRELGATIPAEILVARARKTNGDVAPQMRLDKARAAAIIERLAKTLEDAGATTGETVSVAQSGSLARAVAAIERGEEVRPDGADEETTYVSLVLTRKAAPKTPVSNAPEKFPHLLGSFSTKYDASLRGRTTNLRMAARNIDATVVQPGAVFSANRAIGPRNAAAGWREAKMFVSGRVVSGTGAGICQGSTTIYNAALLCGFPIVERHQHSFRVMYAPASRDAAIAWNQKDFRFRNTSSGPILIRTAVRGNRFHAEIFGAQPKTVRVAVNSEITSRRGGTRSTAWRTIEDETGTRRETLSRDFYRPHP